MKLTEVQLRWLAHARVHGYERGFVHTPIPSLIRLERLGLIERNPVTTGPRTLWRITAAGERVPLGPLTPKL